MLAVVVLRQGEVVALSWPREVASAGIASMHSFWIHKLASDRPNPVCAVLQISRQHVLASGAALSLKLVLLRGLHVGQVVGLGATLSAGSRRPNSLGQLSLCSLIVHHHVIGRLDIDIGKSVRLCRGHALG